MKRRKRASQRAGPRGADLSADLSADLLAWYDRHRRKLPWRALARRAARPLSRLALGDHAAADHRQGGRALLRALYRALAERARARGGAARGRAQAVGRARLLRARTAICTPAPRQWSSAMADTFHRAKRRSRAARHRPLYGGGDRGDRIRRAGCGGRRQRGAGGGAALRRRRRAIGGQGRDSAPHRAPRAGRTRRRFRASADGPWRDHLHAEEAGLRAVSMDGRVRRPSTRRPRDVSAQGAEEGRTAAPRRGLRRHSQRRLRARARARRQRDCSAA